MTVHLIILAAGLLLGVLAVLLRAKLGKAWMISLLCGAVLVSAVGGLFTWAAWTDRQLANRHIYVALQYLQYGEADSASYHLKKVGEDSFGSCSAQALLELTRSNAILAQLRLDTSEGLAATDEQRGAVSRMRALDAQDGPGRADIAVLLQELLHLSERQRTAAQTLFATESGRTVEGVEVSLQDFSQTEQLRCEINTNLNGAGYAQAVNAAARLVEHSASADNRLLLAETVAEAVYNGEYLTDQSFALPSDGIEQNDSAARERQDLQSQIDALMKRADSLQLTADGAADEEKRQAVAEQQAEVVQSIQQLQEKQNHLFANRALNAIADLHSLQAAIVRAKLQYAMQDYTGAVERLQSAANSPAVLLGGNTELRSAFQVLKNSSAEGAPAVGTQSAEFRDAMMTLLSYGGNDMVSAATSNLTASMAEFIMASQKTYGKDLYTIRMDTSAFPQVVVTLSGRDTVLEELRSERELIVRDTHHDVTYTIQQPQASDIPISICCVVDESGSMGGNPTRNLCSALNEFIGALGADTAIGIVGFEDDYTLHAPVSSNHAVAQSAVSKIHAYGGTNITAGIQGGLEALRGCQGAKVILLMTDGQSSVDMDMVASAAADGCVIHTVGFGGAQDDLLTQIAAATGGQYIKAETATELVNIYLSLAGMIGNEVEIHYTVTEQEIEEVCRYFFVRIPGREVSLRIDYLLPQAPAVQLYWLDRTVLDPMALQNARENGGQISLTLEGAGLENVTQVTFGGQNAAITDTDVQGSRMRIEVPPQLAAGWQDITMAQADGTVYTFEKQCYVGELLNVYRFQIGDLQLAPSNAVLTADDRLLLPGHTTLSDAAPQDGGTLSLTVNGYLCIPVDPDALNAQLQAEERPAAVVLQLQGGIEGYGYVSVDNNDSAAAADVADSSVLTGSFTILYEDGQARLVQN